MTASLRCAAVFGLLLVLLGGCSSDERERQYREQQKYLFLESMRQVDSGGRQLQAAADHESLGEALATLDTGLKLAFQVERKYLDELDLRLGKNFQRYFIEGVENYRIGIEAGDDEQQREGLRLLSQWAEFWQREQAAIEARMQP